ncbi:MAG: 50S ribosomal protein L10 [Methanobacteriota archaeon]|nr:MAG: 50S ribosomal protein L10 [Euryarchaeota archaeon]
MREVAEKKKETVTSLVNALVENPVVAITRVDGIPAPQIQMMRKKLRGKVDLVVSKNRLINIALKEASSKRKDIDKLAEVIDGQTAIATADINPFRLFKEMEATKTSAPAKGGEIAPSDIIVRPGDTPFKPGPIVADLQKAGIPAVIEGGKVVIKVEKTLVKEGEKISKDVANALTRLEILPLEVGLDVRGAYEDGLFYDRSVLAIDEDAYLTDLQMAATQSMNLAIFIAYPSSETIPFLLTKANTDAMNLAINANIPTDKTIKILIQKANAQAASLASRVPEAPREESQEKEAEETEKEKESEETKEEDQGDQKEEETEAGDD